MPANFRTTLFFFNATANIGFTETWFNNSTDWITVYNIYTGYFPVRTALMFTDTAITQIRICNVDVPRDSYNRAVSSTAGRGVLDPATTDEAGLDEALLIRKDDNTKFNTFNKLFLHNVPAGIFAGRAYLDTGAPAPWPANFAAYAAFILNPANGFQVRKKVGLIYNYVNLTYFAGIRRTSHKVGRPFGLSVGRRAIA